MMSAQFGMFHCVIKENNLQAQPRNMLTKSLTGWLCWGHKQKHNMT